MKVKGLGMNALTYDEFCALVAKYDAGKASNEDLAALEPYRARRAVLLASGFGSRMLPITINTPKPLVNVNGKEHHFHDSRCPFGNRCYRDLYCDWLS